MRIARQKPSMRPSEIWLIRNRDLSVLFGAVFIRVFGADTFRPGTRGAPIRYGRRPRRRENSFILDSELELQVPALIIRVERQPGVVNEENGGILFRIPF